MLKAASATTTKAALDGAAYVSGGDATDPTVTGLWEQPAGSTTFGLFVLVPP